MSAQRALWGPDELDKLRRLHGEGLSFGRIAEEFGDRNRNSCIGKAHALGLPPRERASTGGKGSYARRRAGEAVGGVRKAYKSKGDDVTLSRFVKVKSPPGEIKHLPKKQWAFDGMDRRNASVDAGRSLFHRRGVVQAVRTRNVLVSGHNNVKIGRDVRKGPLRGYWIYTLSLEERATCPSSCHHWRTCYGNNMPFAKRVDHRDPRALEHAIEANLQRLLVIRGRVGILVRLHALGDFFDDQYVDFWANMLAKYDRLAVYGYTARLPHTQIGATIDEVRAMYGIRFAIRYSDGGPDVGPATVSIKSHDAAPTDAIVCPEQTGKTAACATCGLCWHSPRRIAFMEH